MLSRTWRLIVVRWLLTRLISLETRLRGPVRCLRSPRMLSRTRRLIVVRRLWLPISLEPRLRRTVRGT